MKESAFSGKVAIITGGASGIGAALGKELARAGAEVVLADRQLDLAESVATEIRSAGGRARASEVDVRSLPSVTRLVDETVTRLGAVDYFFNNAGIAVGGEMDTYEPRDWTEVFEVNLHGVANGIQAVYPHMIRQGRGHIVNTASVAGLVAVPGQGSYTATKHAVVAISKALRVEAKRHGVRVSALCPGFIRTPILTGGKYGRFKLAGISQEAVLASLERFRPIDPEELARKAVQAIARNEGVIVIPGWYRALWLVDRFAPSLGAFIAEKAIERSRRELEAAGGRPHSPTPGPRITGAAQRAAAKGAAN